MPDSRFKPRRLCNACRCMVWSQDCSAFLSTVGFDVPFWLWEHCCTEPHLKPNHKYLVLSADLLQWNWNVFLKVFICVNLLVFGSQPTPECYRAPWCYTNYESGDDIATSKKLPDSFSDTAVCGLLELFDSGTICCIFFSEFSPAFRHPAYSWNVCCSIILISVPSSSLGWQVAECISSL